jgi:regulator of cell morphogenesis and NO signaling
MIETRSIMTFFEGDHLRLDQLFANYMKCKNASPLQAKEWFEQFKYGLQQHIRWEEEILFPLFRKKTDMNGPIQILKLEHRQIASLLEALHKKLKRRDPSSEIEEYRLLSLLGEHNLKEEMIIFPAIEAAVTEQEINQIFDAMNRLPHAS